MSHSKESGRVIAHLVNHYLTCKAHSMLSNSSSEQVPKLLVPDHPLIMITPLWPSVISLQDEGLRSSPGPP